MHNANAQNKPNAINIDPAQWKTFVDELEIQPLFVTVSGAHIYGFPSADSDVDLRGSHLLPLEKIVGLAMPNLTYDQSSMCDGLEVDIVSHDLGKYLGLLVKNNGYILEQVFSPMIVTGHDFLRELRPIAKNCITKNHYYHYRGFYANQKKLIDKQQPVTAKAVLYAYRVLCTGIHLLNTGEVLTDLNVLAVDQQLSFIPELVAAKKEEYVEFKFDVDQHMQNLSKLEQQLDSAFANSNLPENPFREPVNELLVRMRLSLRQ